MRNFADCVVCSLAAVTLCAGASNASPDCGWELEAVEGNGVRLFAAAADDVGGLWVAGRSSGLSFPFPSLNFVARWDGQQWVSSDVPQPALTVDKDQSLRGIASLGPNGAIAVGARDSLTGNFTVPQSMRWDGSSWQLLDSPPEAIENGNGSGGFDDVSSAGDTIWAVGTRAGLAPGGNDEPLTRMFATRLVESEWEGFILPVFDEVQSQGGASYRAGAIAGTAADDVWVGGIVFQQGPGPEGAVLAHWDGSAWTWTDVWPLLGNSSSEISDLVAIESDNVWAVGDELDVEAERNIAVLLHWDGSTWSRFDAPVESVNVELRAVIARGSNDVFAAGTAFGTEFPGGGPPEAYVLHFDGVDWTRVPNSELVPESQFFAGAIAGDDELWLVGRANDLPLDGLAQRAGPCGEACRADCAPDNGDGTFGNGIVNVDDLLAVINAFGQSGGPCDTAPANGDGTFGNGIVNVDDLLGVINALGPCP